MNNNLTEIIAILDMSGSMYGLTNDTIGGYNSLLEEQKNQPGEANITTVLFDDQYILLHDRTPIKDALPLTTKEYMPRGTTAMLDAIGKTLVSVGQKLANTPEEERPGTVMVTIITDGYENASKEYKWSQIQEMIKEQKEKYNWIFSFIGADIDTMKVGENLGIDRRLSKTYTKSYEGTKSVYTSLSKAMSYSRDYNMKKCSATVDSLNDEEMVEEVAKMLDEIE